MTQDVKLLSIIDGKSQFTLDARPHVVFPAGEGVDGVHEKVSSLSSSEVVDVKN